MSVASLDWDRDGRDWPNRERSRFVDSQGVRWHVQDWPGAGPTVLLLHGTAASTHSWRDLAPLLAERCRVIAPDLPGHAFTAALPRGATSLPSMAGAVDGLMRTLGVQPDVVVGHSAGAAILARLVLDGSLRPQLFVSLNGALLPLDHVPRHVPAFVARLLTSTTMPSRFVAWCAGERASLDRMLDRTGSRLDMRGTELYHRLASRPAHVAGALDMMAHWDVRPFEVTLRGLAVPLVLVSGGRDRMVAPLEAEKVKALVPRAEIVSFPALGHLAHEERPADVAELIVERMRIAGVLSR